MPPEISEPPAPADRRGFPLLALFLLTAFCSVLAGIVAAIVRAYRAEHIGGREAFWATLGGAVIGLIVGMIVGLFQRRPLAGMLWGAPTGYCLGTIIGPLTLLPRDEVNALFATTIGGAALMIVFAFVTRQTAKSAK